MPDGSGFRSIVIPCGRYRLDLSRRTLSDPAGEPVTLRPKTFDVLHALLLRADRVVSREELLEAVWRNVHVTDDSITHCIAEIRRALGPAPGIVVRTVPRHGYMLETGGVCGTPAPAALLGIAVMPFGEIGDIAPRSLGVAIAEDVAIGLAKRSGICVLMPAPEGGDTPVRGADRILTGTVRRAGGSLRITARLVERASGALLWAEGYDRLLPDGELPIAVDDIVTEIVGAVARGVEDNLSSAA